MIHKERKGSKVKQEEAAGRRLKDVTKLKRDETGEMSLNNILFSVLHKHFKLKHQHVYLFSHTSSPLLPFYFFILIPNSVSVLRLGRSFLSVSAGNHHYHGVSGHIYM